MNLQSGCALERERARDGSSLLCRPAPLWGTFAALTGKRRDDLPPVRLFLPGVPLLAREKWRLPRRGNSQVTLVSLRRS